MFEVRSGSLSAKRCKICCNAITPWRMPVASARNELMWAREPVTSPSPLAMIIWDDVATTHAYDPLCLWPPSDTRRRLSLVRIWRMEC